MLRYFALPDLNNIVRFIPASCATSVAQLVRALGLESRVSWVRVSPEAADFSLVKSSSGIVELLCILEGVSKFVYHVYMHVYTCTAYTYM